VSVVRTLSSAEAGLLRTEDADVTAFGGGALVTVEPPQTAKNVIANAGRRGSLIISEVLANAPRTPDGGYYYVGSFVELYNNSDTTIYLDGKVIARGLPWVFDGDNYPCSRMEKWRNDSLGIWVANVYAFPGSGREHALAPGRTVTVATDAINHSEFLPGAPDLTAADFEFIGSADVDNPAVLNMLDVGLREASSVIGHGMTLSGVPSLLVADAVNMNALDRDYLPVVNPEWRRIPREKILDVFSSSMTPAIQAGLFPLCSENVHVVFDRQRAQLLDDNALYSIRRPVFATSTDGRRILQRTKTSARDFVGVLPPSPGLLP